MNDKEILQDLLTSEKQVISSYSTDITESSCKNLRNTLMNNFKNAENIQYKVFDCMKNKGWYSTKDAPDSEVNQVKSESQKMMSELR